MAVQPNTPSVKARFTVTPVKDGIVQETQLSAGPYTIPAQRVPDVHKNIVEIINAQANEIIEANEYTLEITRPDGTVEKIKTVAVTTGSTDDADVFAHVCNMLGVHSKLAR